MIRDVSGGHSPFAKRYEVKDRIHGTTFVVGRYMHFSSSDYMWREVSGCEWMTEDELTWAAEQIAPARFERRERYRQLKQARRDRKLVRQRERLMKLYAEGV